MRPVLDGGAKPERRLRPRFPPAAVGSDTQGKVRYAFQVPVVLVRRMRLLALHRETTAAAVLREWITAELSSPAVDTSAPLLADVRIQQFPVVLPRETRHALDVHAARLQISTAELMRRLIANNSRVGEQTVY